MSMKPPQTPGVGPTVRRSRIALPDETDATYVLSVLEGPDAGSVFTLDASSPTRALVGSSPVCTVRMTDPQVSRRHAALAITATHVQFIDLGSTNGTTVNGVLVKEVSLTGGEAIRMGASVMTLQRGQAKASDFSTATSFGRIVGESLAMRRLYPAFERLAAADRLVLIEGEAGTGKELLAEELHRASRRAEAPFIVLEASAIPSEQIGARLFGSGEEPGLVESARGGVLFVDEIGDLPRHAQKRLRDLVASSNDVRLIAATRRDLDRDVTAGRFDDAFFFELATGRVELPPLRDRQGDVAVLAKHFWREIAPVATVEGASSSTAELPVDLLPRFEHYPWPGNVRELRSVVTQRATFGELSKTYLSDRASEQGLDLVTAVIQEGLSFPAARDRVVWDFERRYVETVLARHNGNVGAAARASGVAHRYFQLVRARVR
jgi:DNA-binding NtrC family response regulator